MASCACEEFVAGGGTSTMSEEELRADTEREMKAVRLPSGDLEPPPTERDDRDDEK